MGIVDQITQNPKLGVALILLLRFLVAYQRGLSWTEYRIYHSLKRGIFPVIDSLIPRVNFVNRKGYREDKEFIRTYADDVRGTWRALNEIDGSPHLISSIKRRRTPEGPQYSVAHVVWLHQGKQTEAYLFPSIDGSGTDIYAHAETSVLRGIQHITSTKQIDGDPREIIKEL
jgi:hypothetical protein